MLAKMARHWVISSFEKLRYIFHWSFHQIFQQPQDAQLVHQFHLLVSFALKHKQRSMTHHSQLRDDKMVDL